MAVASAADRDRQAAERRLDLDAPMTVTDASLVEGSGVLSLLTPGLILPLRDLAMLGYRPAQWFPDSYTYDVTVFRHPPDLVSPAGSSIRSVAQRCPAFQIDRKERHLRRRDHRGF